MQQNNQQQEQRQWFKDHRWKKGGNTMADKGQQWQGGEGIGVMRLWPATIAAGDPSNLQCSLACAPGGKGSGEEGGAKTTIGGGEGVLEEIVNQLLSSSA